MKINLKRHKAHWKACKMTTNWHNGPKDTQKHCWNKIIPVKCKMISVNHGRNKLTTKKHKLSKNKIQNHNRWKNALKGQTLKNKEHWLIMTKASKPLKNEMKWLQREVHWLKSNTNTDRESDQQNKNENDRWMTINSYKEMTKADKQLQKNPHKTQIQSTLTAKTQIRTNRCKTNTKKGNNKTRNDHNSPDNDKKHTKWPDKVTYIHGKWPQRGGIWPKKERQQWGNVPWWQKS